MHKNNKKGFTLVEIMIVVVIIGLLATLALPAFNKVRKTSQEKAVTENLRQIAQAADMYFTETGKITASWSDLVGTDKYVKTSPTPVGDENYETTFGTITAGFTELTISVPSLEKNVVFKQ